MTTDMKDTELRKQICEIFGVFPEELEHNLPGGIGLAKCEKLEQLIKRETDKAVQEALAEERRATQGLSNTSKFDRAIYLAEQSGYNKAVKYFNDKEKIKHMLKQQQTNGGLE